MLPTLLIVDDERATREGLRTALEDDFDVYLAANTTEALHILKNEPIQLLLTDLRMGGDSGMDLIDSAITLPAPPVILMMTAYGSVDTAVEAMRRGAFHFLTKPLNLDEVEMLLKRALRSKTLETENIELTQQVKRQTETSRLTGRSPEIRRVNELIKQVAPTRATVLIEGESGTGKEVAAHTIHHLSGRPTSKFVIVNCAALSPQLLESELFGHEKGAFTGASQKRIGRFEQAHTGTLFLDEIGEIDATTQVKLLRALSERSIERVGSNKPIKVDVRLIAATNRNLKEMVAAGKFREDLYFRLNVVSISMPTLRERPEDIMFMANSFLKEFARENDRPFKPLTDQAIEKLTAYPWPGNVRELRTAIEHGVVMSNSPQIDWQHLPAFIHSHSPSPSNAAPAHPNSPELPIQDLTLSKIETQAIRAALTRCNDNRTEAAQALGISRRTLQRKIKELNL